MNKITLIIVDCQYDFIDGSLAVPSAWTAVINIIDFINDYASIIEDVIFTVDWHPLDHCSFEKNGGQWPVHCVKHTEGAAIAKPLISAVAKNNINYYVAEKGSCSSKEEYGAFSEHLKERHYPEEGYLSDGVNVYSYNPSSDIVVCGIAGDYCVKETIKNIIDLKPKVFLKGVASIDDGSTIKNFINEHNLEVIE